MESIRELDLLLPVLQLPEVVDFGDNIFEQNLKRSLKILKLKNTKYLIHSLNWHSITCIFTKKINTFLPNTPFATKCAFKALKMLEVVPGVTVEEVLNKNWEANVVKNKHHMQIGRTGQLSSDKSHRVKR